MKNEQDDFRTSQRTGEASNGEGARARDSLLTRVITFLCQPFITAIAKGVRTMELNVKQLIEQFNTAIADLNGVNDQLKANVHAAADQQREHAAAMNALINKLKTQSGVLTDDDMTQLQAIHDGLQKQISALKESANDVTTIEPPDVPAGLTDGGGSSSPAPASGTSGGDVPAGQQPAPSGDPAAGGGQTPPPDGSPQSS